MPISGGIQLFCYFSSQIDVADEDSVEVFENSTDNRSEEEEHDLPQLLYAIEDIPPWYLWILLGFQVNGYMALDSLTHHRAF